jgi:hypothetical protein
MFDWLAEVARYLHDFIRDVPIYVAAPAMVLIGALDSSLLSLPEINDYLVVARCYSDPKAAFYFPLFARVERAYARFGFLALAVPALLPPPMPFKIFVATAGALEYPRWKFVVTIMLARSLRYYVEGVLAVFYGEQVIDFLRHNGLFILSLVASAVLVGLAVYLVVQRVRAPRRSMMEQVAEEEPAAGEETK